MAPSSKTVAFLGLCMGYARPLPGATVEVKNTSQDVAVRTLANCRTAINTPRECSGYGTGSCDNTIPIYDSEDVE